MSYPTFENYNEALQHHNRYLADPQLKRGRVRKTGLGLPYAISGGFALTYTLEVDQNKYAVRCFHKERADLEQRYQVIAGKIKSLRSAYFVDFDFQRAGIQIQGRSYPVVKMAWASGCTLGEFLETNYRSAAALKKLINALESLGKFLERENIAHGDFQTGNLMVSDGGSKIQLIDYDGMFVDGIKHLGSSELGHVNFQHPERPRSNPFDSSIDRFSLISLWLSLSALCADQSLWQKSQSNIDAIVFNANDFARPDQSSTFKLLQNSSIVSKHAVNFLAICKAPLNRTPSLADFIRHANIPLQAGGAHWQPDRKALGPSAYISQYPVRDAYSYSACFGHVGDKVELIGQIVEVKEGQTKHDKPYVFINFADWRGKCVKLSIWSEGLAAMSNRPNRSWRGKWISATGLLDPPYTNSGYGYTHLSISITSENQIEFVDENEARRRLRPPAAPTAQKAPVYTEPPVNVTPRTLGEVQSTPASRSSANNKDALDRIRSLTRSAPLKPPVQPAATAPPAPTPVPKPPRVRVQKAKAPFHYRPGATTRRPPSSPVKQSAQPPKPSTPKKTNPAPIQTQRNTKWLFLDIYSDHRFSDF